MKSTDEVKVGAVTLGGFVILALMLTFLGVFSFASRQYKLNVIFDNERTKKSMITSGVISVGFSVFIWLVFGVLFRITLP